MENRWIILAVLFTVRTVMGIQFQSFASVSSFLIPDLKLDYTQFGILIGLYHLPGVILAFPGGLLGKRFGDKRIVLIGLVLMVTGGLIMGVGGSYIYYGGMMALTSLAGYSRDLTQNAAAPILFGGTLLIIAIIIVPIFRGLQARIS